jgi:hypothetical protein
VRATSPRSRSPRPHDERPDDLVLDLNEYNEQVGRTFRAVPRQVEPITVNLALANMSFFEFADSADPDGVFRDF